MPFLTVGGTTIPISEDGFSFDVVETGSREPMFDASMMETIRARKVVAQCASIWVTRAVAETYRTALIATPPITCTGDLFNGVSTSCFIKYRGLAARGTGSGTRWRVLFTVYEG